MKWLAEDARTDAQKLRLHLSGSWDDQPSNPWRSSRADEMAAAILAFAKENPRATHDEFFLQLLGCRVLCASGFTPDVRTWLHAKLHDDERSDAMVNLLALPSCSGSMVQFLATGLVRPVRWTARGGDSSWLIDTRMLHPKPYEDVELFWRPLLLLLADMLAPYWDATNGKGVLSVQCGPKRAHRQFREWLEPALVRAGNQRKWLEIPEIQLLS